MTKIWNLTLWTTFYFHELDDQVYTIITYISIIFLSLYYLYFSFVILLKRD